MMSGVAPSFEEVRAALQQLFEDYARATASGDTERLEELFADGYVWVSGGGRVTTKSELIAQAAEQTSAPAAAVQPDIAPQDLTVYGDVAVLRHRMAEPANFATTVLARIAGAWRFVHAQGTLLPSPRTPVEVPAADLEGLVGTYRFPSGMEANVTWEGGHLRWQAGPRPQVVLQPLSPTTFFVEGVAMEMTFIREGSDPAIGVTTRLGIYTEGAGERVG